MTKSASKKRRRNNEAGFDSDVVIPLRARSRKKDTLPPDPLHIQPLTAARPKLVCKTAAQKHYKHLLESHSITIGMGPPGTGKSYVATKVAAMMLENRTINSIIVSRPAVGVEEDLGFLPGNLSEKSQPWFQPILDILNDHFGASHVEGMIHAKRISFIPLGHLRGLTFDNCFVILDESQNTTPKQMLALMTRLGEHARLAITGDPMQVDIPGTSGLVDAVRRLEGIPDIAVCEFTERDIVRHPLIRAILKAYRSN